jgi:dimethylhistidine N-methyltransferase
MDQGQCARPAASGREEPRVNRDVRCGLSRKPKRLPVYLFYDERGSALYEQITELPEYYPTRTEYSILSRFADDIAEHATSTGRISVVELGAGTFTKSRLVLDAFVRQQGGCVFVPTDVSKEALRWGAAQLARTSPLVSVEPFVGLHEDAFTRIAELRGPRLVLFLGSSIGNMEDDEALELLRGVRRGLDERCWILLGTDLKKEPEVLIPAYDDAQGVTAAFNKNILRHLNRALGAQFDESRFRHLALWNAKQSRIEMHLESQVDQVVPIAGLRLQVPLHAGERIHTESSIKYDLPRVDSLLTGAGFERSFTFTDERNWFAVHLARARAA